MTGVWMPSAPVRRSWGFEAGHSGQDPVLRGWSARVFPGGGLSCRVSEVTSGKRCFVQFWWGRAGGVGVSGARDAWSVRSVLATQGRVAAMRLGCRCLSWPGRLGARSAC